MKIKDNTDFYCWTEIDTVLSSSFHLTVTFKVAVDIWGVTTDWYGFERPSTVVLRYIVVSNNFPDIYICQSLDISTTTYSITPGSYKETIFSVSSLSSTVTLPLSADTVFIHSLTYFHLYSSRSQLDNTFEATITFRVISSNQFGVQLHSKYAAAVDAFG